MSRFEGRVVLITGAARGQGRNHALRFAAEGADIIAVDACADVDTVGYDLATEEDLAETVRLVEQLDRRILASKTDVRNLEALKAAVDAGVAQLGRLDIVVANAGIAGSGTTHELSAQSWHNMIETNLTGVWNTTTAATPHILAGGKGGSMVLISSVAGMKGLPYNAHYTAAKHGVVGLMKSLANELGPHNIRVNTVNPTNVDTRMLLNDAIYKLFLPDEDSPTREQVVPLLHDMHVLDIPYVQVDDVSNVVLFLAGDESRYVTGISVPVDAGVLIK
ncbi:mycofactocin-coupled SDR family oxidoreductase [Rhodococcoides yunnanense]|uniref:Mycofactocin-coupled SDR family oxidoreductase n=1 Tax=Rhodococcoides yunnanense TaxID=278209 RepID=A0ABU4BEU1_9NOCA|nr:mycofactocin-coupled SDR family oxidoreductase [Rhodococcus yunnanensis]MDV6262727.1 mycofactocin-coupled SDR family oxidoreductase [Rhodococcus yunnanensis]